MSRLAAFLAGLAVALTAPTLAAAPEIVCAQVHQPEPDCTLGGYFKGQGLPLECLDA